MGKFIDMTGWNMWEHGQPNSFMTVLHRDTEFDKHRQGRPIRWICRCNRCGTIKSVEGIELRVKRKPTLSCGCLSAERSKNFGKVTFQDLTNQEFGFLKAIRKVGKNKYGYAVWECLCECGRTAEVASRELLSGEASSCGCKKSLGEATISKLLQEKGLDFEREYKFSDLLSPKGEELRFDFAIFGKEGLLCLIEFQGRQHYEPIDFFGGKEAFARLQLHDNLKQQYCMKNRIPLYTISYKDNIETEIQRIMEEITDGFG